MANNQISLNMHIVFLDNFIFLQNCAPNELAPLSVPYLVISRLTVFYDRQGRNGSKSSSLSRPLILWQCQ